MANPENEDELLAKKWLEGQGFVDIQRLREDPPDYVVNDRNAVEVMRLNFEGEENLEIPLRKIVNDVLKNTELPEDGGTWYVYVKYDFSSFPKKRIVESQIREALDSLIYPCERDTLKCLGDNYRNTKHSRNYIPRSHFRRCLPCGICLDLFWTKSQSPSPRFELVQVSDGEGAMVLSALSENIDRCIKNKSRKIERCINDYENWWLILIDHMHILPPGFDLEELREVISSREPWSRIVIISSIGHVGFYEL